jgi:hypothetical protein
MREADRRDVRRTMRSATALEGLPDLCSQIGSELMFDTR